MKVERTVGVFFIDDGNIEEVRRGYVDGDELASDLYAAITHYIEHKAPDCPLCEQPLQHEIPTFIVLLEGVIW